MAVISAETKIQAVEQYYAGAGSLNQIAERFGVHRSTLQKRRGCAIVQGIITIQQL